MNTQTALKNYLQYHKVQERRGPAPDAPDEGFFIYTNKRMPQVVGARIWLIAGEGRPRRYGLSEIFIADRFLPAQHADFLYRVSGAQGRSFDPPIDLTGLPWFAELRRAQGSFAFGLSPLPERYVALLAAIAGE